ncbi:flagellar hook-associated protein 2 [Gracilibacillus salinarum]|uniref:Flagellar hook-associated protein 2 n=1 Tax=Gracilibacillus salinarum TaxID=2932255 RepID=A0ABY4GLW9_9BACI|nr:flagellar hook-associated protein 2 [Gracilibacillus salinarum]UOQ85176.1 flagellar hook-associated protein 2 [Gracilibacillus salinarum]
MAYSIDTSSRITGLASGIDTESMVKELMAAERIPLDKLNQNLTWNTWKRDAYREINSLFSSLDQKILDMKLQKTYNSKSASSTESTAVTASAAAGASNGTYKIEVSQLATSAINSSQSGLSGSGSMNPNGKLSEQEFAGSNITEDGSFNISYFNEKGEEVQTNITYSADDSLNDVLKKISTETDGEIRASYDQQSDKVIIERTKTGNFNTSDKYLGAEIGFNGSSGSSFLTDTLQLKNGEQVDGEWQKVETGGQDAQFTYNGLSFTSKNNSYTINDITFNFQNETTNPVTITVDNNVDSAYDKITEFVEKYNEVIEKVNEKLQEDRYRDYDPLTDQQKEEMSENEIELWQEKSQSGLLKGDTMLSGGLWSMRSDWYASVENESSFSHLTEIGISTSSDYSDRGKLEIDEDKLKAALREDPDSVHKLFSNDVEGSGRGIINRLEDSIESTINKVEERAGKSGATMNTYTLGKQMEDMEDRISAFEDRLGQIEDRYWNQFSQMETLIQRMNSQSNYLMQQFSS